MTKGTENLFYGPVSAVKEMLAFGLLRERIREVKQSDRVKIKDMTVTVYPGSEVLANRQIEMATNDHSLPLETSKLSISMTMPSNLFFLDYQIQLHFIFL